jgi:hypothetical protein
MAQGNRPKKESKFSDDSSALTSGAAKFQDKVSKANRGPNAVLGGPVEGRSATFYNGVKNLGEKSVGSNRKLSKAINTASRGK